MPRQRKPAYNGEDLMISYLGVQHPSNTDGGPVPAVEIESFRLSEANNAEMYIECSTKEEDAHYTFNFITIEEDRETQRYIVTYDELYDLPNKWVREICKKREFYSMNQYDLIIRFSEPDDEEEETHEKA